MKLPAFQFYPADWRKDPGVQALSYFERGVWFELLCLMHESDKRGYLMLTDQPMDDDTIARVLRISSDEWLAVRTSILRFGVGSVDPKTSALFSRRMVRDTKALVQWKRKSSAAGKASAKSRKHNTARALDGKFSTEPKAEPDTEPTTEPPPNSSSSSSSSKRERRPTKRGTQLPNDFKPPKPPDWLASKLTEGQIQFETEKFLDHHESKGSVFLDWGKAWSSWMRKALEFKGLQATNENGNSPALESIAYCFDCNQNGMHESLRDGQRGYVPCPNKNGKHA